MNNKQIEIKILQLDKLYKQHNAELKETLVEVKVLKKALEMAVETLRYNFGGSSIKAYFREAMINLQDSKAKYDTEICDWFVEQAKKELEK